MSFLPDWSAAPYFRDRRRLCKRRFVASTRCASVPFLRLLEPELGQAGLGNRKDVRNAVEAASGAPLAATDFYQVLDTSDVPGGVVNIVTGARGELARTLAEHDEVAALWHFGPKAGVAEAEAAAAGNLKPVWSGNNRRIDWFDPAAGQGAEYLNRATQVKNVWIPYGE